MKDRVNEIIDFIEGYFYSLDDVFDGCPIKYTAMTPTTSQKYPKNFDPDDPDADWSKVPERQIVFPFNVHAKVFTKEWQWILKGRVYLNRSDVYRLTMDELEDIIVTQIDVEIEKAQEKIEARIAYHARKEGL